MEDRFKFRAWDSKNKKMINVSSLTWFKDNIELIRGYSGEFTSAKRDSKKIFPKDGDKIMQCTGLKDKNGKLIYEGDIIDIGDGYYEDYPRYQEVKYSHGCFHPFNCSDYGHEPDEVEVIGNIYENPELLNKTEE